MSEKQCYRVGDIIRCRAYSGGYRVWRVVGVFLGGEKQESVVELETLDRLHNTQGRMCIPYELLELSCDTSCGASVD